MQYATSFVRTPFDSVEIGDDGMLYLPAIVPVKQEPAGNWQAQQPEILGTVALSLAGMSIGRHRESASSGQSIRGADAGYFVAKSSCRQ